MRIVFLFILAAYLLVVRETGQAPRVQSIGNTPPAMDELIAREVLEEVNALRAAGCQCPGSRYYAPAPALRWDTQLERAAQAHADDMQRQRYFSHTGKDGARFHQRVSRAGYDWRAVGENIAKGYPTAHAVVNAWRTSPDHCPNLMSPKFDDMGVGKNGPYWVQDLGRRR